ncbi:hypothetical protein [Methylosinus sp. PW1]|uniref:hypothetical protein n=1 Tax=Methylosinus sp. PW1 TaxID=107636 RepID=UPI00055BE76B|nr:hypothetical protein [Methylosinus sp. PW1]
MSSRSGARQLKADLARAWIEVPRWVPQRWELDYLAIAEREGEEAAAAMRRRLRAAAPACQNGARHGR